MNFFKQNLGIDVDSKLLKVSFQWIDNEQNIKIIGSRTFDNNLKGFEAIKKWCTRKSKHKVEPIHITLEATGVYYENLAYYFDSTDNFIVHVLLPNKSAAFFKSLNVKSKTDEIDAKILGILGLERKLKIWSPGSDQMRTIKKFSRERSRLIVNRTRVKNQLHAETSSRSPIKSVIKRFKQTISFINEQILEIEEDIRVFINKDKILKGKMDNVCTIKGVGLITAITIVAETDGFALIKNRSQLVSYVGYDVVKHESGTSVRGKTRISKKGNSNMRTALYWPANSALQCDPHHKALHERIKEKTNIPMKGNVAIQRKLLLLIYTLFTKNEPYDPNHSVNYTKMLESKRLQKEERKNKIEEMVAI